MNYNELPDNELNARVAQEAMRHTVQWVNDVPFLSYPMGTAPGSPYTLADKTELHPVPNYCNDIVSAWSLVDKYRLVVRPTVTRKWCAAVLESGRGRVGCFTVDETYTEADTAPRAICLTALKVRELNAAANSPTQN